MDIIEQNGICYWINSLVKKGCLVPTCSNSCSECSSNHTDLTYLVEVCLIKVGDNLCSKLDTPGLFYFHFFIVIFLYMNSSRIRVRVGT